MAPAFISLCSSCNSSFNGWLGVGEHALMDDCMAYFVLFPKPFLDTA